MAGEPQSRYPDDLFGPGSSVRVIGHRGAAAFAPENTLPSFRHAVETGADAVELDLQCTRCGHLVVIHDDTVDRTTDSSGSIESMDLEELKKLDAGHRFTPDQGQTFPFRGQEIRVPTFEEVLVEIGDLPVVAEIKSPRAGAALGNWLIDSPERDRILVGGFRRSDVDPAGKRARWRCAYTEELRWYVLLGKLGLAGVAVPRVDAAMVPERHGALRVVSPRFVRRAHLDGIGVFVWTVNEADDMRRLLDWNVDGLVSDAPGRLRRILDERIENAAVADDTENAPVEGDEEDVF
jgi:glycerophosphoryl diester phosphodiesterase